MVLCSIGKIRQSARTRECWAVAFLNWMVKDRFTGNVIFELKRTRKKGTRCGYLKGIGIVDRVKSKSKGLEEQDACGVEGAARRPVWLELRGQRAEW